MSRRFGIALAALLILAGVLVLFPAGYANAGGTIENPGFECGEDGIPVGWNVTGNATRVDTPPIYAGNWSAQLIGEGDTLTQWVANVTAGTTFMVWGWIYASGNVTGVIAFDFWACCPDEEMIQLSPTKIVSASDTGGVYEQVVELMQAPPSTTHARIRLLGTGWDGGGEVRFDDIGFWVPRLDLCFIATAAYGTPMAEEIQILRDFRDAYLLTNPVGGALVSLYYRFSPPLADFITEHSGLKPIVRAILSPAVVMSHIAVNTTPAQKGTILGAVLLVLVVASVQVGRRSSRNRQVARG
jgi:hypothetical protein